MIARRSLALAAVLGFAGTTTRAQDRPDTATLREQLMALERESWEYVRTRNRAALRRLLADDALLILADGTRYSKSEILGYVMPDYRLDSFEIEPTYAVRMISPDVAALLYRVTSRGAARFDRTTTDKVRASSVYVRRGGQWKSVLYQETPIK